jgi:hypothetical protein
MSLTWTQFSDKVGEFYNPSAKSTDREERAIDAVSFFVKAAITREVFADLPLARSYENSYMDIKLALAGYTITSNFGTVKTGAFTRLTKDGDRAAISAYSDLFIKRGIDDFNGAASTYNALLVEGAVECQRHVECLKSFHTTDVALAGVTNTTLTSTYIIPPGMEIRGVFVVEKKDALAINQDLDVGDEVLSNGRVYVVTEAGNTGGDIGDGLLETQHGEDEIIGTVTFQYLEPEQQVTAEPAGARFKPAMDAGLSWLNPVYSINPDASGLTLYPALDADHVMRIWWSGLKTSFSGSDVTPFYPTAAQCVAEFIRGFMEKNVAGRPQDATRSLAAHAALLKRLWLDCGARRGNNRA